MAAWRSEKEFIVFAKAAPAVPESTGVSRIFLTREGRVRWLGVFALFLVTAITVYIFSRGSYERRIVVFVDFVAQLQNENRKLAADNTKLGATIVDLQGQVDKVKAELHAIMPSEGTYNIRPNQSIVIAAGQLAIGLVGSPANQTININVNGEQRAVAAGDVIQTTLKPSTTCKVSVQSFDMFRAVVTANCAEEKPQ